MGAAGYDTVHAKGGEDPDAVHPSQYLSLAYVKTGARFAVDVDGALTLELDPV